MNSPYQELIIARKLYPKGVNTAHARLIYADEMYPYTVTHHTSPRDGVVHNGHPRICDDEHCRQWGVELMEEEDRETVQRINDNLQSQDDGPMTVVVVVVIAAVLALVTVAYFWGQSQ